MTSRQEVWFVNQDTKFVTIDSTQMHLDGLPKPRVMKRKDDRFILLYSATSPTSDMAQAAKSKGGYSTTDGT